MSATGQIPKFRMRADPDRPNEVEVTCTRTGCHGEFTIKDRKKWARGTYSGKIPMDTRSCPYCFRVSYIRNPRHKQRSIRATM